MIFVDAVSTRCAFCRQTHFNAGLPTTNLHAKGEMKKDKIYFCIQLVLESFLNHERLELHHRF